MTIAMTPTIRTATRVGDELALIHEGRMQQVAAFLTPALSEEADFWSRWAVARFLSDRFAGWFRQECALLDGLGPLVPEAGARTIAAARAGLEQTIGELVAAGRRRENGILTARLVRRFLDQLALWFVEVELATDRIETADLPAGPAAALSAFRITPTSIASCSSAPAVGAT
jgi:hypothetical protein